MEVTEHISNHHSSYPSIEKLDTHTHTKANGSLSIPVPSKPNISCRSAISDSDLYPNKTGAHISTATIYLRQNPVQREFSNASVFRRYNEIGQPVSPSICADDIGLEIIEPKETRKPTVDTEISRRSLQCIPSVATDMYEADDNQEEFSNSGPPTPPRPPPPLPPPSTVPNDDDSSKSPRKRTFPISIFLLEIGALIVIFILSMVLVLAIREEQVNLRATMHVSFPSLMINNSSIIILKFVYTYIYLTSIIWMIWCMYDIRKFRRQWLKLTSSAYDQEEYMDIVERHPQNISYFPDIHNTGGLFMRFGAACKY
jgi:hypothetical protein